MAHRQTEIRRWVEEVLVKEGVEVFTFSMASRHQCVTFYVGERRMTCFFPSTPRQSKDQKVLSKVRRMVRQGRLSSV